MGVGDRYLWSQVPSEKGRYTWGGGGKYTMVPGGEKVYKVGIRVLTSSGGWRKWAVRILLECFLVLSLTSLKCHLRANELEGTTSKWEVKTPPLVAIFNLTHLYRTGGVMTFVPLSPSLQNWFNKTNHQTTNPTKTIKRFVSLYLVQLVSKHQNTYISCLSFKVSKNLVVVL